MTSVEWLEYKTQNSKWLDLTLNERKEIIQQAKEMHKVEIIDAWIATDNELQRMAAEQYYNETFKK
jgi:hypothetical protein